MAGDANSFDALISIAWDIARTKSWSSSGPYKALARNIYDRRPKCDTLISQDNIYSVKNDYSMSGQGFGEACISGVHLMLAISLSTRFLSSSLLVQLRMSPMNWVSPLIAILEDGECVQPLQVCYGSLWMCTAARKHSLSKPLNLRSKSKRGSFQTSPQMKERTSRSRHRSPRQGLFFRSTRGKRTMAEDVWLTNLLVSRSRQFGFGASVGTCSAWRPTDAPYGVLRCCVGAFLHVRSSGYPTWKNRILVHATQIFTWQEQGCASYMKAKQGFKCLEFFCQCIYETFLAADWFFFAYMYTDWACCVHTYLHLHTDYAYQNFE